MAARILTLDIERAPFLAVGFETRNAFIGIDQIIEPSRMISLAAKWYGEKEILFYSEFHDGFDEMVKQAHRLIDEADILVGYNSKKFDHTHLQTEYDLLRLKPPSPVLHVDLWKTISSAHKLDSSKLNYALRMFDLPGKVSTGGMRLWIGCMNSDPKSWALMKKYNIYDVKRTEQLYKRIRPYIPNHPHMGIYNGEGLWCPNCGSGRIQKRGYATTQQGMYARYQCQERHCGKWMKGTKTVQPYQQTRGI
jgi:DNA polymerase elongation subunit (family B)